MDTGESSAARSCKYVVAARSGRWRVSQDERDAGAFAEQDDAVRFACRLARDQAKDGIVGIVVVQANIQEMHCFTPPPAALGALRTPQRPKLRLVGRSR